MKRILLSLILVLMFGYRQKTLPTEQNQIAVTNSMDGQMRRFVENGLQIREIVLPPGMCMPATYLAICQQVARVLGDSMPDKRASLQQRMLEIRFDWKPMSPWRLCFR